MRSSDISAIAESSWPGITTVSREAITTSSPALGVAHMLKPPLQPYVCSTAHVLRRGPILRAVIQERVIEKVLNSECQTCPLTGAPTDTEVKAIVRWHLLGRGRGAGVIPNR